MYQTINFGGFCDAFRARDDGSVGTYNVTMRAGRTLRGSPSVYERRAIITTVMETT